MEPSKDEQQSVVLALHILAVTTETLQQHEVPFALPPTAFARVIAWSHGQVSVDTGDYSEWGNAKPVLLSFGATAVVAGAAAAAPAVVDGGGWNASTAIELEVSMWDKQQAERPGDVSRVMLDAVAEVNLPALEELGTSEKQAIEK